MRIVKYALLCTGLGLTLGACGNKDKDAPQPAVGKSQDATVLGPYTGTPTLTKILSNYKIVFSQQTGTLAAGLYFCDVYKSELAITLPAGQYLAYNTITGASQPGYSDFTTQTTGTSLSQQTNTSGGTDYKIVTYSVIATSNSIGQRISEGPFPQNLIGNTFTYSIIIP